MNNRHQFRRLLLAGVLTLTIFVGMMTPRTQAATLNDGDVISVDRFHDDGDFMYASDIQALFETHNSTLAHYYVYFSLSDTEASAANIIAGAALSNNLNPKVLLALIETRTQLITQPPDDLTHLKYPFGWSTELPAGFAAQVWSVAESLNRDYVKFAVEHESLLVGMDRPVAVSAATWAIQEHLNSDGKDFEATYLALFEQAPTAAMPEHAQAVVTVRLSSPYDGEFDDPDEITALFDHEYPNYSGGTYLTHWSGECRPNAGSGCTLGETCYSGHDAYDYGIPAWSNIYASADGTVVFVGADCAGQKVILEHTEGLRTAYWHLRDPLVEENDVVTRGQLIGRSGGDQGGCSTGAHLHFNVTLNNMDIDPFGWEGDYVEPCSVDAYSYGITCAPGQYLWQTGTITPTVTPTTTLTPTITVTPTVTLTPSATPTPNAQADGYEPDDAAIAATGIQPWSPQEHNIVPKGDHDWVRFTVTSASAVTIWTNGPNNDDTEMWLYDASLTLVEQDDDGGSGKFSRIDRICEMDPLPAGVYYVKVTELGDFQTIYSYNIEYMTSVCTLTPPPTVEPFAPQMYIPMVMQGE